MPKYRCTNQEKRANIQITRSKGDSFKVVYTIAEKFIEVFLKAFLKGPIKVEEDLKNYEVPDKIIKNEEFDCDKCDRRFITKQGLRIHMAQHTKKFKADITLEPNIPVKQNEHSP